MPAWDEWSRRPQTLTASGDFQSWFAPLADRLLNQSDFLVLGDAYRFAELEVYYWGEGHFDPFTHGPSVQIHTGRWYFHRSGGQYRAGSFKGLDLTFGDGRSRVGMLIRSLIAPDGTVICGPSLVVDHLLARAGETHPAGLDARLGDRLFWDESALLSVRASNTPRHQTVYRTARVGLSLKRAALWPEMPRFVMKPYRYLTEPKAIAKGRPQLVLALWAEGRSVREIAAITGVAPRIIEAYGANFEAGRAIADFAPYFGRELSTAERCRLMGTWSRAYAD